MTAMTETNDNSATRSARDQILEAAIVLMKQSGLTGAGINQILARSGTPKGSLYHYFPDGKQQIAIEALTIYAERVAAAFERTLSSKKKPTDKIRALLRFVADRFEEAGFEQSCAAGAVTLDLNADVAAIQPVIAKAFKSWRDVIARHLPIRSSIHRESFAGLVLSTIEGAYVRGRAERSMQPFVETGEWLAILLQQIEKVSPKLPKRTPTQESS
jgi:TetR/AcrR family transcriptional regulator, lmrAB and yxaGH operons repressor